MVSSVIPLMDLAVEYLYGGWNNDLYIESYSAHVDK